jgi:hypothetical protein
MDEIFLKDYANNVAQAQDPFGVAAVQAQPGFENYTPSFENQSLTPMGLTETQGTQLPDFKEMAKNIAMNTAKNYAIKKIGLEGIKGNVLNSVIGASSFTNPIGALYTVGSLLPDGVRGIAEVLRSKRAQKAIERDNRRDSQGSVNNTMSPRIANMQPTAQESYRGGGGGGYTSSAPSSPAGFDSSERGSALHG